MSNCIGRRDLFGLVSGNTAHLTGSCFGWSMVYLSSLKELHDRCECVCVYVNRLECHFGISIALVQKVHLIVPTEKKTNRVFTKGGGGEYKKSSFHTELVGSPQYV